MIRARVGIRMRAGETAGYRKKRHKRHKQHYSIQERVSAMTVHVTVPTLGESSVIEVYDRFSNTSRAPFVTDRYNLGFAWGWLVPPDD